jgi:O-antigen/teichoic acid export membrane protein
MSRTNNFERFAATGAVSQDLKRRSVLGALAGGAGGGLSFVLRLGSTLILARLLIPEYFGLVAMVTAITRIAERFATLGLSTATVQAPKITDGQCSNLFWINVAGGSALAGLLVLASPKIAGFYDEPRLQLIAMALSLNFVMTGLTVQHEALLVRQMKLVQVASNQLVATLLSSVLAVTLAATGFGYWALVFREIGLFFFTAVGVWILARWLPRLPNPEVEMRRLLSFGRDMTLTQLLVAVSNQLDSLLIGRFGGATALGLYRQAYNVVMQPVERLRVPIYNVSQPGLSILQGQPARYRRYYRRVVFAVSFATVPLGLFVVVYAT